MIVSSASDVVAVGLLWLGIVLSVFSAGFAATKKEKSMGICVATLLMVYCLPTEGSDPLYLFRVTWFILPVWLLLTFHSAFRIRRFYVQKG